MLLNDSNVYREKLGSRPGSRVLAHLTDTYRHASEEKWRARFARGEVRLDDAIADGSEPRRPGQWLCWHRPLWEEEDTFQSFELVDADAEPLRPRGMSGGS